MTGPVENALQGQYTLYIIPIFVAAIIAGALMLWGIRRYPARGADWFTLLMLAAFSWALCYGLEMLSTDLSATLFWSKMQYLGAVSISVAWLALVLTYTGQQAWLTPRHVASLFIIPAITLALVWTNESHELIWVNVGLEPNASFNTLSFTPGIWYWVNIVYAYALFVLSTLLLVAALARAVPPYRQQIIVLLAFSIATWLGNLVYTVGLTPQRLNLTPLTFALSGLLIAWGLFRYRILDIAPVARDAVVESMSDAVIVLDHQAQVVDLNPKAQELLGDTPANVIGRPLALTLADWPVLAEHCQNAEAVQTQVRLNVQGEEHIFDLNVSPLLNRRGRLIGRLLLLHDFSKRWQAEEELRKLSRAAEQSASTIVITDLEGDIEYANPAFTRITGYARQEVLGQNPRILKSGKHPPEMYKDLWATISSGGVWQGEMVNKKRNGELYWEAATISPITDESGQITHYLAIKEDITERKRMEEALQRYTVELEAQNAELDAYAHTVAHDLKNPLTSIIGYSAMLQSHSGALPDDQRRTFLQTIEQAGLKMRNIIDELLLLASVRGMEEIEVQALDMGAIVAGAQERLAYLIEEEQAESRGHSFGIVQPDEWPAALGYGPWVEEVWANYISNALKYGGRPPRIELGFSVFDSSAETVRFWVRDNGPGLSAQEQAHLFTPFERLHQVRAEGHGLGLSIVQRIVEKLGGQVGVESQTGQGSLFYFSLPVEQSDSAKVLTDGGG